jgi:hypothetical protein
MQIVHNPTVVGTIPTDAEKLKMCYFSDLDPKVAGLRMIQILNARLGYLSANDCKLVSPAQYAAYFEKVDGVSVLKSDDPLAALLGIIIERNGGQGWDR